MQEFMKYSGGPGGPSSGKSSLELGELNPPSAREVLAAAEAEQRRAKKAEKGGGGSGSGGKTSLESSSLSLVVFDPCACW